MLHERIASAHHAFAGFVRHDGGECPIDHAARVQVQFADESLTEAGRSNVLPADRYNWRWLGGRADIVAYRVEGSQA